MYLLSSVVDVVNGVMLDVDVVGDVVGDVEVDISDTKGTSKMGSIILYYDKCFYNH